MLVNDYVNDDHIYLSLIFQSFWFEFWLFSNYFQIIDKALIVVAIQLRKDIQSTNHLISIYSI